MRHEKIVRMDDNVLSRIKVEMLTYFRTGEVCWYVKCDYKPSDAKSFKYLSKESPYYPTPADIIAAKLELWEKIKPTL